MLQPAARRIGFLLLPFLAATAGCDLLQPLLKDVVDNQFADQRRWLGVPHAGDVLTNLAFLAVGLAGLIYLYRRRKRPNAFEEPAERWPFWCFYVGLALTGFGSAWYHLSPTNDSLFWDRLPMTVAFAGILSAAISDHLGWKLARPVLAVSLVAGPLSVLWWWWTESQKQGDLRPYAAVQLLTILALALLPAIFPGRYTQTRGYWIVLASYLMAKAAETADLQIWNLTGGILSGHNLKHLLAAAGAAWLLRMLAKRQSGLAKQYSLP